MRKLLSLEEVAHPRSPFSLKALRMKVHRNEFPHIKLGRKLFVEEEELDRYLDALPRVTAEQAASNLNKHTA